MLHDELRAVMHGYFRTALADRIEQIGAKGPQSELELAPQEATQMLAGIKPEDCLGILAPNGTDAWRI